MTNEVGVGLVGYGAIGRVHALCYRMLPLCYPALPLQPRIVAVATASEATAARARRELGDIFVTRDVDALVAHDAVGLVDCCAPTADHATIARAALRATKALFCEKPLAATLEDSAAIARAARERNLAGGVNFHFRFIPAIQEAHRLVREGLLGDVISFHLRYYRASNIRQDRPISWRFTGPGSGVLLDLGSHLIDMTHHLLGPIASVAARTRTLIGERPDASGAPLPIQSDDVAWLHLTLVDGGVGTVEVSKMVPGAADDVRLEAYGARGTLIFDASDPNGLLIGDSTGIRRTATFSKSQPTPVYPGAELPTATLLWHLASLAAFFDALGRGEDPRPSLEDGVLVDRVLAAARRSAAEGGVSVRV